MRVLVTGGAGYIGSHAVRELLDAGHEVRVLDDLSAGHRAALAPGAPFFKGDLADARVVGAALDGVAAVVHFAGLLSVAESVGQPGRYYQVNVGKGIDVYGKVKWIQEEDKRMDDARFLPYQAGDGFFVEVRAPIPAAERGDYKEFAAAR